MHVSGSCILCCAAVVATVAPMGCAEKIDIPASAMMVGKGSGLLPYIADDNGTIYLFDTTENRPAFAAPIQRGQTLLVSPKEDRIDLAGKAVEHKSPLNGDHAYRLYFDRQ